MMRGLLIFEGKDVRWILKRVNEEEFEGGKLVLTNGASLSQNTYSYKHIHARVWTKIKFCICTTTLLRIRIYFFPG